MSRLGGGAGKGGCFWSKNHLEPAGECKREQGRRETDGKRSRADRARSTREGLVGNTRVSGPLGTRNRKQFGLI